MKKEKTRKKLKEKVLLYLLLACLFIMIREPFYNFWCGWGPIASLMEVKSTWQNDLIAAILMALGILSVGVLTGYLSDTGNKWTRVLSGAGLYMMVVCRICYGNQYTPFATVPWLRYADILMPILVAWLTASCFKPKSKTHPEKAPQLQALFYDDVDEVDFLGRTSLVEHLCQWLTDAERNQKSAIGIAITGSWGTGKSWVLEHVRKKLQNEGQICIVFKPWLYGEADMSRMFYRTLEKQLESNDYHVEELKKAITEIDNDKIVGLGRAFLSLFGIVTRGGEREQNVIDIQNKLRDLNQPIYVFIDDCDRLAQKELIQVLSLIRNTGDFPGLTYVLAFDKKIAGEIIDKETGLQYVGKMTNLTVDLPPVNDDVIADYLNQAAGMIFGTERKGENPYQRVSVTRYLPTVREAKKYLNLLMTDYKRLESRFEHHYCHLGDFCLIELLKYKYPDFYYGLQSNPEKYIRYNKAGWNSPVGLPVLEKFEDRPDLLALMKALFRNIGDPSNQYEMIGVANKTYFPIYFEKEPNGQYVDTDKFDEAYQLGILPHKVKEWLESGYTGILDMCCTVHKSLSRKDVFLCMVEYIWYQCEKLNPIEIQNDLSYAYGKDANHGINAIMQVVRDTSQISMLTFQHLSAYDNPFEKEGGDSMEKLILESDYVLELMGIWLWELKSVYNTDYPYDEVRHYVMLLWHRIMDKLQVEGVETMDVLNILEECTLEDTFHEMVLPLVTNNPQRWLGATVMPLHDGEKDYYILRSRGIHAIFGSLEKMYDEMKEIVNTAMDKNKEYVEAYQKLIYGLAAMTVNKKDSSIDDKYKQPENLEVGLYPQLTEGEFIGDVAAMPVEEAVAQIKETSFWKGDDLRLYRNDPGYYLATEI